MDIQNNHADDRLLIALGARLAAIRLARNMTQAQLATDAGLGLRTVQRLEQGAAATHLSGFLRVCRVLGLLDQLDMLIPEPAVSPIAQLRLQKQRRQRATRTRKQQPDVPKPSSDWTWGTPK
jgi:transcriptional regulator with XRE-family HTH domain